MTLLGLLVEEALGDAPPYRGGDTWPRIPCGLPPKTPEWART